jgi:pilus assembly protein CpaE
LITVVGASGGSGASTLAANMAACLSQKHSKCALVDLKLEAGDLATLLNLQPVHSLADFCENAGRMDQSLFERCFAQHPSGVWLLAPPSDYTQLSQVTAKGVRKALAMSRNSFPYVVVDLDQTYRREHAQALFQSDVVVIVMRLDFASLRQTRRFLDYLDSLRIDRSRVRLAVNRYQLPQQLRPADVQQALEMKIAFYIPDDPKAVNRANNKGTPVVLDAPRSKASVVMSQIAFALNGAVPKK